MFISLFIKESRDAVSGPEYPRSVAALHSTLIAFSKKRNSIKLRFPASVFFTESRYGDHRAEYPHNVAMLHSSVVAFFTKVCVGWSFIKRDILVSMSI
jgi:hypothetical protein